MSLQGWKRVSELPALGLESRTVFVAMWFDREMSSYWESAVRPVVEPSKVPSRSRGLQRNETSLEGCRGPYSKRGGSPSRL
jgi:hypothetical protein